MAYGLDNHSSLSILAVDSQKGGVNILLGLQREKRTLKKVKASLLALGALLAGFLLFKFPAHTSDQLSGEEVQTRLSAFNENIELVNIDRGIEGELNKAYQSLTLPENELTTLKMFVEQSVVQLAWFTIWDDLAEDGDTVEVSSTGYQKVMVLTNQPQTIAIPVSVGNVTVTGVKDGTSGGITAGIKTSSGEVLLPVMQEGQVITLKVM